MNQTIRNLLRLPFALLVAIIGLAFIGHDGVSGADDLDARDRSPA